MISTLKKIIIIDLEATCYEDKFPQDEHPEIIQIGVCLLNLKDKQIKNKTSYLVRPHHSTISGHCENLTGITPKMAKRGMRFDHARNKLAKEFGTRSKVWAAWGEGDRLEFARECKSWNTKYPFSDEFINVSGLFALAGGFSQRVNLEKALGYFNLEFYGTPHHAEDDAYNTACILRELLSGAGQNIKKV